MKLISSEKIPYPKRTIRFLFGMEFHSISAYTATNPKETKNIIGAFYVDTLGGSPQKTQAPYLLVRNHDAIASYTDVLLEDMVRKRFERKNPYLKLVIRPFWGNDPAVANDPLIGIQMTSLIQHPNKYYHTSQDTPDLLTRGDLEIVGPIPAAFAYFVANISKLDATWLLMRIVSDGKCRLEGEFAEAGEVVLATLVNGRPKKPDAVDRAITSTDEKIRYTEENAIRTLKTLLPLIGEDEREWISGMVSAAEEGIRKRGDELLFQLRQLLSLATGSMPSEGIPLKKTSVDEELEAGRIIPKKLIPGLLTFRNLPEPQRKEAGESYRYPNAMYWVDGKRTVLEIARLHRQMSGEYDPSALMKQFSALAKFGYVMLREKA